MRIVTCYKCVPNDTEIRIQKNRELNFDMAQLSIGRYDLEAVEAAVSIAKNDDGVIALTYAGKAAGNSKLRKAILSRGPAELYVVHDNEAETADSLKTATVLNQAIQRIGDVDLVICGEGSEDMYSQQVGVMIGAFLGWTTVNAVAKIERNESGFLVERELANGTEVLEITLPAVVCMCAGATTPRIPSMRDILAAGKKPFLTWEIDELGNIHNTVETISVLSPDAAERKREVVKGSGEEEIEAFYQMLRKSI